MWNSLFFLSYYSFLRKIAHQGHVYNQILGFSFKISTSITIFTSKTKGMLSTNKHFCIQHPFKKWIKEWNWIIINKLGVPSYLPTIPMIRLRVQSGISDRERESSYASLPRSCVNTRSSVLTWSITLKWTWITPLYRNLMSDLVPPPEYIHKQWSANTRKIL